MIAARARRPCAAQARAARDHRPATDRHRGEQRHHHRRHEQVAHDHRQARRPGRHEGERARQEQHQRHDRAQRELPDRDRQAQQAGEVHGRLDGAAQVAGQRRQHVATGLRALQLRGEVLRRGEREQRVAGHDEVRRGPQHRPDRGQRRIAEALGPVRVPAHPEEVDARQDPCLGAQQTCGGEQQEDDRPAARPRDLQRAGPHDRGHEGDVEVGPHGERGEVEAGQHEERGQRPDERREAQAPEAVRAGRQGHEREQRDQHHHPVGVLAEQRQRGPEHDRQRVLGGRPVGLEARLLERQHLLAPEQRVVAVVVRVRHPCEEPDRRPGRTARRTPRRQGSRQRSACARLAMPAKPGADRSTVALSKRRVARERSPQGRPRRSPGLAR